MKRFKFIFLTCFLCASWAIRVGAQEAFQWEDCVKEAYVNNPDLISAAQGLKQTEADKRITQSAALPQISTELTGKKSKAAASNKQSDSYSYGVSGRQLLFDGFKTSNDIAAAKEDVKASQYNYAVVSSNVRLNLRTVFAELLRAQALISLTEDIAQRRKQNLELVQLRYEGGREHKGALLTAQADFAQAEFEVEQAKRNLSLAQAKLIKELGWQNKVSIRAEGDFAVADSQSLKPDFVYLADNTPFLKELAARKEAARFGLKSAKADFFPQIYLTSSIGKTNSYWAPDDKEWSAGLSVSFPLFEGGSRIAKISKEEARAKQAQADERSGRDSVIVTLEATWKDLQDAIDEVSVQEKFLKASQERAKIANAEYSTGLIDFDDWIIIEDELVRAKKAYLNAQTNMLIAEAKWVQAKGGVLEYAKE
ncbi:MAG: TolC family protein [Candidatus Omnitrophota bacterium]|nr:MAG: TolC family protein [Candidatus Omnitrophota bacterium]